MIKKNIITEYSKIIVINKKIRHNYDIKEELEAGLVLLGWEIKSIRQKKVNINNNYIIIRSNEYYLLGSNIQPLENISRYAIYEPMRNRKLLLHKNQIDYLTTKTNRTGYTISGISLFWKKNWCKLKLGIVKGKKTVDKREDEKKHTWEITRNRIIKRLK